MTAFELPAGCTHSRAQLLSVLEWNLKIDALSAGGRLQACVGGQLRPPVTIYKCLDDLVCFYVLSVRVCR